MLKIDGKKVLKLWLKNKTCNDQANTRSSWKEESEMWVWNMLMNEWEM